MNLTPLGNYVLVQRLKQENEKQSLLIVNTPNKKEDRATVISVGEGLYDDFGNLMAMSVKKGDIIFINNWAGQEFIFDDIEYTFVRDHDIIAVIQNE